MKKILVKGIDGSELKSGDVVLLFESEEEARQIYGNLDELSDNNNAAGLGFVHKYDKIDDIKDARDDYDEFVFIASYDEFEVLGEYVKVNGGDKIDAGDNVLLIGDELYGYYKGDEGVVVTEMSGGAVVFVNERNSQSCRTPNVYLNNDDLLRFVPAKTEGKKVNIYVDGKLIGTADTTMVGWGEFHYPDSITVGNLNESLNSNNLDDLLAKDEEDMEEMDTIDYIKVLGDTIRGLQKEIKETEKEISNLKVELITANNDDYIDLVDDYRELVVHLAELQGSFKDSVEDLQEVINDVQDAIGDFSN